MSGPRSWSVVAGEPVGGTAIHKQVVFEFIIRFKGIPYIAVRDRNYPIRQLDG